MALNRPRPRRPARRRGATFVSDGTRQARRRGRPAASSAAPHTAGCPSGRTRSRRLGGGCRAPPPDPDGRRAGPSGTPTSPSARAVAPGSGRSVNGRAVEKPVGLVQARRVEAATRRRAATKLSASPARTASLQVSKRKPATGTRRAHAPTRFTSMEPRRSGHALGAGAPGSRRPAPDASGCIGPRAGGAGVHYAPAAVPWREGRGLPSTCATGATSSLHLPGESCARRGALEPMRLTAARVLLAGIAAAATQNGRDPPGGPAPGRRRAGRRGSGGGEAGPHDGRAPRGDRGPDGKLAFVGRCVFVCLVEA